MPARHKILHSNWSCPICALSSRLHIQMDNLHVALNSWVLWTLKNSINQGSNTWMRICFPIGPVMFVVSPFVPITLGLSAESLKWPLHPVFCSDYPWNSHSSGVKLFGNWSLFSVSLFLCFFIISQGCFLGSSCKANLYANGGLLTRIIN